MLHQTIEKLHTLRLTAMADALQMQMTQPDIAAMPFEERLAILVDLQHSAVLNAQLKQRLKRAGMRQTACIENLDLRTPRNLDRGTIHINGVELVPGCQIPRKVEIDGVPAVIENGVGRRILASQVVEIRGPLGEEVFLPSAVAIEQIINVVGRERLEGAGVL